MGSAGFIRFLSVGFGLVSAECHKTAKFVTIFKYAVYGSRAAILPDLRLDLVLDYGAI